MSSCPGFSVKVLRGLTAIIHWGISQYEGETSHSESGSRSRHFGKPSMGGSSPLRGRRAMRSETLTGTIWMEIRLSHWRGIKGRGRGKLKLPHHQNQVLERRPRKGDPALPDKWAERNARSSRTQKNSRFAAPEKSAVLIGIVST